MTCQIIKWIREQCWKFLGHRNNDGAFDPLVTTTGGAWVHALSWEKKGNMRDMDWLLHIFSHAQAMTPFVTCKRRYQHKHFDLFSFFRFVFVFFSQSVVFSFFFRWQFCCGAWSDSPTTHTVRDLLDWVDHRPLFLLWLAVRQVEV